MTLRERLQARMELAAARLFKSRLPPAGHDAWCECPGCCAADAAHVKAFEAWQRAAGLVARVTRTRPR